MASVCVVGLPSQLQARLVAACRRWQITLTPILAGKGKEGILWLLPHPREVKPILHGYVDGLASYADGIIVVLQYVPMPADLEHEIAVLEETGAKVTYAGPSQTQWPTLATDRDFDEAFRESLFLALTNLLQPGEIQQDLPSEYFARVCGRSPNLLLATTVMRRCDTVTRNRYQFMRDAADAFEALLKGDPGMSLDQFFESKKLLHAKTGKITAKVAILKSGSKVYSDSTETHLKDGDATTKADAARIYYHRFSVEGSLYVAVLHAGPHPDRDFDVVIVI